MAFSDSLLVAYATRAPVARDTGSGSTSASSADSAGNSYNASSSNSFSERGGGFTGHGETGFTNIVDYTARGAAGVTTDYVQGFGTGRSGITATESGPADTYTTTELGTGTDTYTETRPTTTTTSASGSTTASWGDTGDITFEYADGTMASTITLDVIVTEISTLSYSTPTTSTSGYTVTVQTTGAPGTTTALSVSSFTTSTDDTYEQTYTSADTSTRTVMGQSMKTITLTAAIELCNPTYFVPPDSVAWRINADHSVTDLVPLSDIAQSFTDSFTVNEGTVEYADDNEPAHTGALITFYECVATNSTTISGTYLTAAYTTATTTTNTFELGRIANATGTTTTSMVTTSIASQVFNIDRTTENTDAPQTAGVTTSTTKMLSLAGTTTEFIIHYDSNGRADGFTTALAETVLWSSYSDKRRKGENADITYNLFGINYTVAAEFGSTVLGSSITWGFLPADTGQIERVDPWRPAGIDLPTGKITDRRAHLQVSAGSIDFPARFWVGQMGNLAAPLPLPGSSTTTDTDNASYTVDWSELSVSVTKDDGAGTSTAEGVLSVVGAPRTEQDWFLHLYQDFQAFGGTMNDGRNQQILRRRAMLDATLDQGSLTNGSTVTNNASTAAPSNILAFAYMPAVEVVMMRGSPVVIVPRYADMNNYGGL